MSKVDPSQIQNLPRYQHSPCSKNTGCTMVPGSNAITEGQIMFQVRIHGRGGQGVVTGAEMMSIAAFLGGKHAQAFPSFGSERTGAPVVAFCRMDDKIGRASCRERV